MEAPPTAETVCTTCQATVPATRFCVRCGSPLTREGGRRGFAAAPEQPRLAPWIVVSSLFPRLPRSSMRAFQVAGGVGLVMVCAATLVSAFPLAIVLAAVLVPVLTVTYVVDVHVYEGAPWRVLGLTAAWGFVAGIVVWGAARALAPDPADLLVRSRLESLLVEGTALPLLGLALAVVGPALLLLDRRFDDVLDGVTFGMTTAVVMPATTLLFSASALLADGLKPGGSVVDWLARLLVVAVVNPVLWASVVGSALGAVWQWRRPPARGSSGLGPLGNPLLAFALAAALLVANAAVQLSLPLLWALPPLVVLSSIGLVWLRHSLHAGLLQEAGQVEIGPGQTCANCGARTPQHTFCCTCGIAVRALPKGGSAEAPGSAGARIRTSLVPAGLGAGLLALGAATTAIVLAFAPTASAVVCEPGEPCGGPPSDVPPLGEGATWESDHGVSLVYGQQRWSLDEDGDTRLVLSLPDGSVWVAIETTAEEVVGGSDVTPAELPGQLRAVERLSMPLHGPNIGHVQGVGAWHAGFLDSPQAPRASATIARLTSRRRNVTVRATAVFFRTSDELFDRKQRDLRGEVDSILNTVRWGANPATQAARAPLPGGAVAAPREPTRLGPTAPDRIVDLSLTLVLPGRDALHRYAQAVTDPRSQVYGQFLTPDRVGERFGLPERAIAGAVRRLERAGLDVVSTSRQRTGLGIRAPAARVNSFFGVTLFDFRRPDGTLFRRPTSRPRIPSELAGVVDAVVGLDTESPPEAMQAVSPRAGLRPPDVAGLYEIQPLWDARFEGKGQTVAIVALDSFRPEDIEKYDELMKIRDAPEVERVFVTGQEVQLGANVKEVSLDIEVVRAVAPQAQIVVFEAELGWPGFIGALEKINEDERVDVASISFGRCLAHVDQKVREAMETQLAIAVDLGKTIFVASGDSGAFSCIHLDGELADANHELSVDWPAASPNVVGVGGTQLAVRSDGSYFAESGWEDPLSNYATGGGVSTVHDRPRWQRGPGQPSARKRQVPDVAGPADCDNAFLIVYPEIGPDGREQVVAPAGCGTSAAAPFWAGVAALALEFAERDGGREFGFLAPVLYDLARGKPRLPAFRDVKTGGNLYHPATPGWDYATGLGTPRAWNLARDLYRRR